MTASVTIAMAAGPYGAGVTYDAYHSNSTSRFYPEHSSSEQVQGVVGADTTIDCSMSLLDLLFLKFYW